MASVTESFGRFRAPETFRLVVVTEVKTVLDKLVRPEMYKLVDVTDVAVRFEKKALVEVTDVPVAEVKPKAPDNVPPVSNK